LWGKIGRPRTIFRERSIGKEEKSPPPVTTREKKEIRDASPLGEAEGKIAFKALYYPGERGKEGENPYALISERRKGSRSAFPAQIGKKKRK